MKLNEYNRFWTAGQRRYPGTDSEFIWRMYPGGPMKRLMYRNWQPQQPDFGHLYLGKLHLTESCIEMLFYYYRRGTRGGKWNDEYCHQTNYALCELNVT